MTQHPFRTPHLLRFLAVNCIIGVLAGWAFLGGLLLTDAWGLASTIFASADPVVPIVMLLVVFAITFGAAAMGTAVLLMPGARKDRDWRDGKWPDEEE